MGLFEFLYFNERQQRRNAGVSSGSSYSSGDDYERGYEDGYEDCECGGYECDGDCDY